MTHLKPFDLASERTQQSRLNQLAINALQQYPLAVAKVTRMGNQTNALYKVVDRAGQAFVLRVCAPGWRTDEDRLSEVVFLDALAQSTDVCAPRFLPASNGASFITAQAPGVMPCTCMLMTWLEGSLLDKHLNEANMHKMGQLFAVLHQFAVGFTPPSGFTRRKLNSLYARGEVDVLFGDACADAFSPQTRAIFTEVMKRVTQLYAALFANPAGLRVIHHDLHHENIKVWRNQLCPFDFEDVAWGYPVQDVAMAWQDLMMAVPWEDYQRYIQAFRQGYETLLPWVEAEPGQIDLLRVGRMIWVTNWVARHERQHLKAHIDWVTPQFEQFLDTGVYKRP